MDTVAKPNTSKIWFLEGLSKRQVATRAAFCAMVLFSLALIIIIAVSVPAWIKKPFAGFLINQRLIASSMAQDHWSGKKAGLTFPDKILRANNKDISSISEFHDFINSRSIGDPIRYLVEKKGRIVEVTVPVIRFTWTDFLKIFGHSSLNALVSLLLGFVLFMMKPDSGDSRAFVLSCFLLGISYVLTFDVMATHFGFIRLWIFTTTFFPAAALHLSLVFPERRRWIEKHPFLKLIPYLVSAILIIPLEISYPRPLFAKMYYNGVQGYRALSVVAMFISILYSYFKGPSFAARTRAKVVLLGAALAFPLPLVFHFLHTLRGFVGTSVVYILVSIFPASIAYAIAKHDLFAIDLIVRRTAGYVLSTATIVAAYALIVLGLNVTFQSSEISKSPMFSLIFLLAVVFFFNPLRNRIQKFIDRVFYRLEYDYQETVQRISETMRSLLNLNQIVKAVMDTALGTMFIDSGSVMLLNRSKQAYELFALGGKREERGSIGEGETPLPAHEELEGAESKEAEAGEVDLEAAERTGKIETDLPLSELKLPVDNPLIQKITERKKEVTIYDVETDPFYEADRAACKKAFDEMKATLIMPLIYEDRLTGLISLGEKKSGKFYQREDINLLNTLANQGAVAIENALLLEEVIEKERMEEELAIAHDLQTSMLPATCPEIEGFEIAASSTPAREVGGDFFDFIELEEDRLGLVIGDVTGKSVSGALVMSASRSVFRMLSEEELSVGEIMTRANRRIKEDVKSGMFVALLYAVLNAKDKTLSLCSAGQTQPIHLSTKTGEAILTETEGDTFPLGILGDADYQETRLQLAPGDKVVFYTDGIVEAMNEKEEIFGFDRLLEVVREAKSMNANALLKEVINRVNEFVGGAAQHDDLTVIVVSVEE